MLECVINVSEGRDGATIDAIAGAGGAAVVDRHTDADHHRTVLTVAGPGTEAAARAVARHAVRRIDLRAHQGAHPRLGAVDVVPFVALAGSTAAEAQAARDRFAGWAAEELGVPCFLYGLERSLPDVRRHAFRDLMPDVGGLVPHPTAGAMCVGVRGVLVAYNVWLADEVGVTTARHVAAEIRGPALRALGLQVGGRAQVSMNLVDPLSVGPAGAYDAVAERVAVAGAELVGLLPAAVLEAVPEIRWDELDLARSKTIEAAVLLAGY